MARDSRTGPDDDLSPEALTEFSVGEQAAVAGESGTVELKADTGMETETKRSFLAVTHGASSVRATSRPGSTYDTSVIDSFNS